MTFQQKAPRVRPRAGPYPEPPRARAAQAATSARHIGPTLQASGSPIGRGRAFFRGLLLGPFGVTGFVMFATSMGFGALARDLGFSLWHTLFMGIVIYALPGQVVLVDELARGAGILSAALAVTLTGVRMLPMTVTLIPLMNDGRRTGLLHVIAVHFVSVTSWIEGQRHLPALPERLRLSFFLGMGIGFALMLCLGSMAGYVLAGGLPPLISAALLLMTPLYFMISLISGIKMRADTAAIVAGVILGPVMFWLIPGFDLLLTGLVGGTLAWLIGWSTRR